MTRGVFITGTDTGVGKTVVGAVIARLAVNAGLKTGIMKPVTSGCIARNSIRVSEDAELLAYGAGLDALPPEATPYLFSAPVAPSVAAAKEGSRIDLEKIATDYATLAAAHDFMVVEGAGGLMVPLAGGLLMADLIRRLDLPVIVVARPGLGTVNHTLLTCFTARQMGIPVTGVIITGFPDQPDEAEEYAPHLIGSLTGAPLLGVFPRVDAANPRHVVDAVVARIAAEALTVLLKKELGLV
jgi:dethiobiotin synthetase